VADGGDMGAGMAELSLDVAARVSAGMRGKVNAAACWMTALMAKLMNAPYGGMGSAVAGVCGEVDAAHRGMSSRAGSTSQLAELSLDRAARMSTDGNAAVADAAARQSQRRMSLSAILTTIHTPIDAAIDPAIDAAINAALLSVERNGARESASVPGESASADAVVETPADQTDTAPQQSPRSSLSAEQAERTLSAAQPQRTLSETAAHLTDAETSSTRGLHDQSKSVVAATSANLTADGTTAQDRTRTWPRIRAAATAATTGLRQARSETPRPTLALPSPPTAHSVIAIKPPARLANPGREPAAAMVAAMRPMTEAAVAQQVRQGILPRQSVLLLGHQRL
jgi:hypothetical protein